MSQATKRTSLVFLFGALISLVVLSGSLSTLKLHAGTPFPGIDSYDGYQQAIPPQIQAYSFPALPRLFGLILLLLILYVLMRLVTFVHLKWLLPWLLRLILGLTAIFILLLILSYLNFGKTGAPEWILEMAPLPSTGISTSPLGRTPNVLIWFVKIGFTAAMGLLIIKIFIKPMRPAQCEDPLVQPVKIAMQALRAGKEFENVIIHCYFQMANALQEELGIERSHQMTAREFQEWLEFKGLPRIPVQSLTTLFEKARYGKQRFDPCDEKLALDSLGEIIHFAERAKDEVSTE